MIRRGSGRTPPFIVVGLVIIILIFGFNYWTLSSQNADAQQELEKLQAEIKISAMKQEQSDNKNAALQETVHEMDGLSAKLKKKLEEGENFLKNKEQDNSKKTYEITDLKNKLIKMQERIETLAQQIEDRDADLVKAKDTHLRLVTERDDAVEAIAEKDTLINTLKRQLEQAKDEAAAVQREKMAVAQPNIVPGPMNLPNIENRAAQNAPVANAIQDSGVRDTLIAPQPVNSVLPVDRNPQPVEQLNPNEGNPQIQPPGRYIIPAPIQEFHGLAKPRFSKVTQAHVLQQPQVKPVQGPAVVERPAPPVAENNQPIAAPVNPAANPEGQDPHNDVLAPPPQHNEDNLDAAIDEEEKIVEDLMDDQDEEGNEVKHNNENVDEDNGQEDNKDLGRSGNLVGAVEVPQQFHQQEDTHQDMNLGEDLTNQGNYYETNLDNNIRNLRRPPELH